MSKRVRRAFLNWLLKDGVPALKVGGKTITITSAGITMAGTETVDGVDVSTHTHVKTTETVPTDALLLGVARSGTGWTNGPSDVFTAMFLATAGGVPIKYKVWTNLACSVKIAIYSASAGGGTSGPATRLWEQSVWQKQKPGWEEHGVISGPTLVASTLYWLAVAYDLSGVKVGLNSNDMAASWMNTNATGGATSGFPSSGPVGTTGSGAQLAAGVYLESSPTVVTSITTPSS